MVEHGHGGKRDERAEAEIERQKRRGGGFVIAVERTGVPMVLAEPKNGGAAIVYANPSFYHLTGYDEDEVLGQDLTFLAGRAAEARVLCAVRDAIRSGHEDDFEILQHRKDGSRYWSGLRIAPIHDERGRVCKVFASLCNITRRKEAEEAARRAHADLERRVADRTAELAATNRRLEALLAERETLVREAHHRVKNSLQLAASIIQLQSLQADEPAAREALVNAQTRLAALARVHEVLHASRSLERADPAEVVEAVARALVDLFAVDGASIKLALSLAHQDWPAEKVVAIGIIVNELVSNALKYAFPFNQGTIRIELPAPADGRARLVVRDDGIGLQGFVPAGTTLGRRLVQAMVESLGGEMRTAENGGLCIEISFSV